MDLFQRRINGVKHPQDEVNQMMTANYNRARKIEQEKQSLVYQSQFNVKMNNNLQHYNEVNLKY